MVRTLLSYVAMLHSPCPSGGRKPSDAGRLLAESLVQIASRTAGLVVDSQEAGARWAQWSAPADGPLCLTDSA